ncbi:SDR family NAD(P)-dependent oxidoreductase [Sphingomonas colocasiae]|uniref:SDR family oxidoreductase n=1 Tax=Sphingomonas colocasiae TaxID=1848973 RepID=A0ABS7PM35_9SPHN|nr:SDR family NAD(P)-dependent oxidoreductase [Sphingomonas colocasiae]MBY8822369.1 SDR family oxidoreductase [Sphingomonas colocasiae]
MGGRLQGKSAVITGAGSGIGRATALLFARNGARLVIGDKADSVHETAKLIRDEGGEVNAIQMNAGKEEDVKNLVQTARLSYGGLDIAYANAGISGGLTGLFEHSVEDWQQILQVNLVGPFLLVKHAAQEIMKKGSGSIICTASVAGIRSGAGCPAYSASKAGVINLVQTAAQQLSGTGVRVNAICPGLIETGMTERAFVYAREKGVEEKIGRLNPLRRAGQPEEIAFTALFLASDESSYVNGQAIAVDGGLSSSHPVTRQETGKTAA